MACLKLAAACNADAIYCHCYASTPDTTQFPQILAYLDLHDAQGRFVHGLLPGDVQILENGISLPVDTLQETRSGVQFVTALNLGSPLAVQNSQAVSRASSCSR